MNILYSSSDSYAFLAGISILSLLENNRDSEAINIYIMDNGISEKNKMKINQIVAKYARMVIYVPLPDMKKLTGKDIDTRRWNVSTFGRLYMASVLPDDVHKVLNIDCDSIIIDSIEAIWNTDMTNKVVGGMSECINNRYRRNIEMDDNEYYVNGGIILLNLDEVRKNKYEDRFTDYIRQYGSSLAYLDQDAINHVVEMDKKVELPMRFNMLSIYFYATYKQVLKIRRSNDFYDISEYKNAINNPAIVHFTTCFLDGLRPWIQGNRHPYLNEFLKYKKLSPWCDVPLQEDNRSNLIKIRSALIKKLPRVFTCEIASLLHGIIVPNRNAIKMKNEERRSGEKVLPN